jgi:hypothetical protein
VPRWMWQPPMSTTSTLTRGSRFPLQF